MQIRRGQAGGVVSAVRRGHPEDQPDWSGRVRVDQRVVNPGLDIGRVQDAGDIWGRGSRSRRVMGLGWGEKGKQKPWWGVVWQES